MIFYVFSSIVAIPGISRAHSSNMKQKIRKISHIRRMLSLLLFFFIDGDCLFNSTDSSLWKILSEVSTFAWRAFKGSLRYEGFASLLLGEEFASGGGVGGAEARLSGGCALTCGTGFKDASEPCPSYFVCTLPDNSQETRLDSRWRLLRSQCCFRTKAQQLP